MSILAVVLGWLVILPIADQEASVVDFVKAQHAELSELLVNLKGSDATEYERAIRDLGKTIDRLNSFKDRDRDRYELELKHWQSQSRIDLLSARLQMSPNDELKSQLRLALGEQWKLKHELLGLERDRTVERLKRLNRQLDEYGKSREATVEKRFQLLTAIRSEKSRTKSTEKRPALKKSVIEKRKPADTKSPTEPSPPPSSR